MPSLLRTSFDSRYLPVLERSLNDLKQLKPAVRAQLSKDYMIEEEELRGEVRERVDRLCEGVRALEGEEPEEDEDDYGSSSGGEY